MTSANKVIVPTMEDGSEDNGSLLTSVWAARVLAEVNDEPAVTLPTPAPIPAKDERQLALN